MGSSYPNCIQVEVTLLETPSAEPAKAPSFCLPPRLQSRRRDCGMCWVSGSPARSAAAKSPGRDTSTTDPNNRAHRVDGHGSKLLRWAFGGSERREPVAKGHDPGSTRAIHSAANGLL